MPSRTVTPTNQDRPFVSVPLNDANLGLDNANWQKGLQAMSDWIWSGNLNPVVFPNHLARFFLQIPGVFEQQLNFSTTLIFDEPSFKNGIQISGFVDRVTRELVISYIAQHRRCQYSMTHHAVLGRMTAQKHGLTNEQYRDKWSHLVQFENFPEYYTDVEIEALRFASAFSSNPKSYSNKDLKRLKDLLRLRSTERYVNEGRFLDQMRAARKARAQALLADPDMADQESAMASKAVGDKPTSEQLDRLVDAQIVELSFLCLQFVALTCVFTGLNIPDEDFLPAVMMDALPVEVIETINRLNALKGKDIGDLVPPGIVGLDDDLIRQIENGELVVEPVSLKGTRVPLVSYEDPEFIDNDKGTTVGGINVGTYGWGFGAHFPGSLVYALMHHPELARFEAPYSLPVLFNEDEWRNGVHTSGFVTRRLKEIVIQKVYKTNRSRYGIEHHTMFLYNTYLDEHGVGQLNIAFNMGSDDWEKARSTALNRAHAASLWLSDVDNAPDGIFTSLEIQAIRWTEMLMKCPHDAHEEEEKLREMLQNENEREINAGLRKLDVSGGIGRESAMKKLLDHQISELCMMIGHMDGLGRAMMMLQLESETAVSPFEHDPESFQFDPTDPKRPIAKPVIDSNGKIQMTGYYNFRFGLFDMLRFVGVNEAVLTLNELSVNEGACQEALKELSKSQKKTVMLSAKDIEKTAEF